MVAVRERRAAYVPGDAGGLREQELTAAWLLGRVPASVFAPWGLLRAGRAGRGPGPDVREAAFALPGGTVLAGDVEVHLRASDFVGHGHRDDPAYGGVVLHLAWIDDRGDEAGGGQTLAGGRIARTVAVAPGLGGSAEQLHALVRLGPSGVEPCHRAAGDEAEDERGALLRHEGERRLAERAWRAGELAARLGWGGAWAALLDRALASSAGRRCESPEDRVVLAASVSGALGGEPLRGLAGLAVAREPRVLIDALRGRYLGVRCLGAGRAAEVGWNAALPLLAALAAAYGEVGLARDVAALVAAWPAPRPYGRTLALAEALVMRPRRAVEAQGLLHVQELWCERGGCGVCPLSLRPMAAGFFDAL
ncbi:MAG: DUF2851 family protein [Dehalococcoidia bacterium]